jgi:hypothetical protein
MLLTFIPQFYGLIVKRRVLGKVENRLSHNNKKKITEMWVWV